MTLSVKQILFVAALVATSLSHAQRPSVNPIGLSDSKTDQLRGQVEQVLERTVSVDYSRHTVEPGEFISSFERNYSLEGAVTKDVTYDEAGLLLTRTIYQYSEGRKTVSTTYDANGNRTLQTLYAFTADGHCARMRFTDAIGVTISTSEVSHTALWASDNEVFADGEKVNREYFYNEQYRLLKITSQSDSDGVSETTYTLDAQGFPRRAQQKSANAKHTIEYEYTIDEQQNWIRRVTTIDGRPAEITTRTILYY